MSHSLLSHAVTFTPTVQPDWDHARTISLALRSPAAEWSQSSITVEESDGFWAPDNLFSYQGLLCLEGHENWKYLDRLAFKLHGPEGPLVLKPGTVAATPESVTYRYETEFGVLSVLVALIEGTANGHGAWVNRWHWDGPTEGYELELKPWVDIRHMYAPSDPGRHRVNPIDGRQVTIVNRNHILGLGFSRAGRFVPKREQRTRTYPLGRGERIGTRVGVCFQSDVYKVFSPGVWRFDLAGALTVTAVVGTKEAAVLAALDGVEQTWEKALAQQSDRLASVDTLFARLPEAVRARIYVQAYKFTNQTGQAGLPDAGGWWFRTPWFRNVFESYLHNRKTLKHLGQLGTIEQSLRLALRYQEPGTGRLPNRVPEVEADHLRWEKTGSLPADYYVAPDGITLLFTLVDEIYPELMDDSLFEALWVGFKQAFAAFKAARLTTRHGNPVLLENGLLVSVPSHSWMNGKRVLHADSHTIADLPIRCPSAWQKQDLAQLQDSHYTWEAYQYPNHYLPEINAQWIRMLACGRRLARRFSDKALSDELDQLHALAIGHFKTIFWNPHTRYLYNVVNLDLRADGTPSAAAIEAVALLGEQVFSRLELEQIWQLARDRLLVKRKHEGQLKAFGIVAKDGSERIFYGDQQYHEAVVWPRETPYLLKLLEWLGQRATIAELLATNLAHQMDEGVLFYCQELFSLPEGTNPSPSSATQSNPVPVKNPMQAWSSWCDAYL